MSAHSRRNGRSPIYLYHYSIYFSYFGFGILSKGRRERGKSISGYIVRRGEYRTHTQGTGHKERHWRRTSASWLHHRLPGSRNVEGTTGIFRGKGGKVMNPEGFHSFSFLRVERLLLFATRHQIRKNLVTGVVAIHNAKGETSLSVVLVGTE
jgi:hypothetical protein